MRSRRTLVLVVASLLVAAAAFAVLSRFSPVQTTGLTFPICTQEWGSQGPALVASCVTFMQSYSPDLSPVYVSSLWWHQSYLEIAEGFAILALLLPLLTVKRLDLSWLHRPLAPRFPARLLTALVIIGGLTFALFTAGVATFHDGGVFQWFFLTVDRTFQHGDDLQPYGAVAFVVWGLTLFALALRRGLVGAIRAFGLPALLFLTAVLLALDSVEMVSHVTMFLTWSLGGIPLLNNWSLFVVSVGLTGSTVYVSSLWWHQSYLEIAEGFAIRTYIRADGRGLEVEAIAPCSHGDQRKVHRWTILKIGAEPAKESA